MISKYTDYLWGDSELKEITIKYDSVDILLYNEVANHDVRIECQNCSTISSIMIGDDWLVDQIIYNELGTDDIHQELSIHMISGAIYCFRAESIRFIALV